MIYQEVSQPELFRAVVIYLGVLIQGLIFLLPDMPSRSFFRVFVASLWGFLPSKKREPYLLSESFFYSAVFFIVLYSMSFKDKVLRIVNERTLLSYVIVFWYTFMKFWATTEQNRFFVGFFWVAIISSLISLLISFTKLDLKFFHLWMYIWHIAMIVFFSITFYEFDFRNILPSVNNSFDVFLTYGMFSLYSGVHIIYLYNLLPPLPDKKTSYSKLLKEWKKYLTFLKKRFKDKQSHNLGTFAILLILGVLFALKIFIFPSVSELTFISSLILFTPYLSLIKVNKKKLNNLSVKIRSYASSK